MSVGLSDHASRRMMAGHIPVGTVSKLNHPNIATVFLIRLRIEGGQFELLCASERRAYEAFTFTRHCFSATIKTLDLQVRVYRRREKDDATRNKR